MSCPADLRDLYSSGSLIPFVGAGISMSVTWTREASVRRGPSWAELVDEAARRLGFQHPDLARVRGTDLQILEYYKIKEHGSFYGLTNWLVTEMHPPDKELIKSAIHKELAQLDKCNLFYTTNYDDFLERAFELHGRPHRRIAIEAHMATPVPPGACDIVKFHGDLENPDRMVLTESDYERRLALDTEIDYRFRADLFGRAVLFIGYSFRDWNVSYLFRLINDKFKGLPSSSSGRRAYITVADPSDFEIRLFRERNMEVLPISGRNQTSDVAELLSDLRG